MEILIEKLKFFKGLKSLNLRVFSVINIMHIEKLQQKTWRVNFVGSLLCVHVMRRCLKEENFKFFNLNKSFDHPPEPLFFLFGCTCHLQHKAFNPWSKIAVLIPAITSTFQAKKRQRQERVCSCSGGRVSEHLYPFGALYSQSRALWGVRSVLVATCPAEHPEFIYCSKMREQTLDSTNGIWLKEQIPRRILVRSAKEWKWIHKL